MILWVLPIIFLANLIFNTCVFASNVDQNFNVKLGYSQLDIIQGRLNAQNVNLAETKILAARLMSLRTQSKTCVDQTEARLKAINKLLASIHLLSDQKTVQKSEEYKYLQAKKELLAQRASDCRLFIFKSHDALEHSKKIIQRLGVSILLKRSPAIMVMLKNIGAKSFAEFNFAKMYQLSGIAKLTPSQIWILGLLVIIAAILGIVIGFRCRSCLNKPDIYKQSALTFFTVVKNYIIPLLIFGFISIFLTVIFLRVIPSPAIELISYCFFAYTALLAILNFILAPPMRERRLLPNAVKASRSLFRRLAVLGFLILIGLVTVIIFRFQPRNLIFINIIQTCYLIILSFAVVWVCWLFNRLALFEYMQTTIVFIIRFILLLFLIFILTAQFLGYHRLAFYLVTRLLLTFAAVFVFWLIVNIMEKCAKFFNADINELAQKVRSTLGLKPGKRLGAFIFIKIAVWLIAVYLLVISLLLAWGMSTSTVVQLDEAVINGFTFANIHIAPLRIVIALFVFGILLILGKFISTYISKNRRFSGAKEVQGTMDSIVNYATFGLALLLALLVAGVNFTGLAVIAGALSVGIGMGLQVIVNNFVSGVILLLDKNINPGDFIMVNNVEGVIKKISLRSTQITNLAKEDVIVPNTELFTNKVINYSLRGKFGRIVCKIGVVAGSNIATVTDILLAVAHKQQNILQEEPDQPRVLFHDFSNNTLNFSLFCAAAEVAKKQLVASELAMAVETALQAHKIAINSIST